MNENLGQNLGELEIADLIEESVANAAQRRQQFMDNSLVDLTEDEAKNIEGGLSHAPIEPIGGFVPFPLKPPIVLGMYPFPIGIIIKDPIVKL
uniref:Uncharacterized protein n=1 Tax=Synechococcus sp. PCC 9341 TaxID=2099386 RepID=A0A2P0ZGG4_9SYNE|nr:hypothetical protein [Synechococcus sp. PCC 9341]